MLEFIVFLSFSIVCFLFTALLYHSQHSFEKECRRTEAKIVSYRVEDNSSYDKPVVEFVIDGKKIITYAQSVRTKACPQIGERVPIAYVKSSFAGHDTYRVRLIIDGKAGTSGYYPAIGLAVLGLIFLVAGIGIFAVL